VPTPATKAAPSSPAEIGTRLGTAMAIGMRGDGLDTPWPDMDVLDPDLGDPLTMGGIELGPAWREAEVAAEAAYRETMSADE
jgi:hypothetical protein